MLTRRDLRRRRKAPSAPYRPRSQEGQRIAALRVADAPAWAAEVVRALRSTGTVLDAAAVLGVTVRSLRRWLRESPGLRAGLSLRGPGDPTGGANLGSHLNRNRDLNVTDG